jgi:hypothetical protein
MQQENEGNVGWKLHRWKILLLLGASLQICWQCAAQSAEGAQPAETSVAATKIAGTVVSSINGTPLAQARVSIAETRNRANTRWVITTEDGRFEFDRVPAGKYSLQGAKRGFLAAAYQQHERFSTAIVTGTEFDTANLVLRLIPMARMEGKVVDESGDPVREGRVTLYRENHGGGITRIMPAGFQTTNDLGTFEFASLSPGKYFVSVSAKPWYAMHPASDSGDGSGGAIQAIDRSLDVAYPTTFSGGATEAAAAAPIELKGGDRTEVEIHLFPVPSLHLIFRIPDDDGQHGVAPPILEKRVFGSSEYVQANEVRPVSKGVYELAGVPAGTYSVRMRDMGSQQETRMSELDLRTDGQELDTSGGELEGSLKLTVQMPRQEPVPKQMAIALLDTQHRTVAFRQVSASGEALMQNLAAGKYTLVVYSPGKPYSVQRISSDGRETAGHEVSMLPGSSLVLTVMLTEGTANIEGFAKRGGKAASGVMVVLIPMDPGTHEELFRRDQSDSDGSFSMRGVIPGKYTLVAIEDAWGFDWSKPAQLAHYAKQGQAITIPVDARTTIELPEPIEVQPR